MRHKQKVYRKKNRKYWLKLLIGDEVCEQSVFNGVKVYKYNKYNEMTNKCYTKKDEVSCKLLEIYLAIMCSFYNGTFCTKNCESSYYFCINGKKTDLETVPGTVCYQSTKTSIIQINSLDSRCRSTNELSVKSTSRNCPKENGNFCLNECKKGSGYYECRGNVETFHNVASKIYFKLENEICLQYRTDDIQLINTDNRKADLFDCKNRVYWMNYLSLFYLIK